MASRVSPFHRNLAPPSWPYRPEPVFRTFVGDAFTSMWCSCNYRDGRKFLFTASYFHLR
jgi:hypothetical protein